MMTTEISYSTSIDDYEAVASNYHIVELINGDIIVTPPPTIKHQRILRELSTKINELMESDGEVFFSPVGVRTKSNEIFEPDLVFISNSNKKIIGAQYIEGPPDLVIEITTPSTAHRDWNVKKSKYEEMGIMEYWIVDTETDILHIFINKAGKFVKQKEIELFGELITSISFPQLSFVLEIFNE